MPENEDFTEDLRKTTCILTSHQRPIAERLIRHNFLSKKTIDITFLLLQFRMLQQ